LPLPQRAVQAAHAAIEAGRRGLLTSEDPHPHLVFAEFHDLPRIIDKLDTHAVGFAVYQDPDIDDEITAIATRPLFGKERRLLKNVRLVGG
jgi:hypothetical protein